jgi:hypothetical protein
VRFDATSLPWFWQYVDPALLKADLARSLWHLHSQPPMFNFLLGLVLKLFPGRENAAFTVCWLVVGLAFAGTMLALLRGLGVPARAGAVLTAVYVASPACVLYENWLFYTWPVTLMLLLGAWLWHRFLAGSRLLDALLLFTLAALTALTWSVFHLGWLLLLVLLLVTRRPRLWRRITLAALAPLLLVSAWYLKNQLLFGQFTASTWFGLNFSKMTNSMLTAGDRGALKEAGVISAVSLVAPFSAPERYYEAIPRPAATGIPVLDQELKPSGVPNFNNSVFIRVSRGYGEDGLRILARRPGAYLNGLANSYLTGFRPSTEYLFLARNAGRIRWLERFSDIAFSGRFFYQLDRGLRYTNPAGFYLRGLLNAGWFTVVAYALVFGLGLLLLLRPSSRVPHSSSLVFLWFNATWLVVAGNALEVGENNRFRFAVDPLVFVFLVCVVRDWLNRRTGRG